MNPNFIKNFLKVNWFILWGMLVVSTCAVLFSSYRMMSVATKLEKDIAENSKAVILLTASGHPIKAEKSIIDSSSAAFSSVLKNTLTRGLVFDYEQLTKNYRAIPEDINEIYNAHENFTEFGDNFVAPEGRDSLIAYVKRLGQLIHSDNLPEKISITSTSVADYATSTEGFSITLVSNVGLSYFLRERNEMVKGVGAITIKAEGFFNPSRGTVINPLGIQFRAISVTPVAKRTEK